MWNDLTMQQRADVIAMAVKSGMRDLSSIRAFYDESVRSRKFAEGGEIDVYSETNDSDISPVAEFGIGMFPIVGAGYDIYQAIKDPSIANVGIAAGSTILDGINLLSGGTASVLIGGAKSGLKQLVKQGVKAGIRAGRQEVKRQVVNHAAPQIARSMANGRRITHSMERQARREASQNAKNLLIQDLKNDAAQQTLLNFGQMGIQTEGGKHWWEK